MGLWSRTYVCCAVPLYNVGVYAIMAQFAIVSLVTGILCFAAPKIIAVSAPSFAPYILGVACIAVAVFQLVGFLGVYREKPAMFKNYVRFNTVLVVLALVVALVFIILSAAKHSDAVSTCENLFADRSSSQNDITSSTDICNVWMWVQIGIMGLLFVIVGLCEAYFVMFTHIYSSEQKLDHARYNSIYSNAAEEIRQSGLWDVANPSRSSFDDMSAPGYPQAHARQPSGLRNEIGRYDDEGYLDDASEREKGYGVQAGVYPGEERFEPPLAGGHVGYGYDGHAPPPPPPPPPHQMQYETGYSHYDDPFQRGGNTQAYHAQQPYEVQQAAQGRGYAPQGHHWDPAYGR